jgi:hypothetical protein
MGCFLEKWRCGSSRSGCDCGYNPRSKSSYGICHVRARCKVVETRTPGSAGTSCGRRSQVSIVLRHTHSSVRPRTWDTCGDRWRTASFSASPVLHWRRASMLLMIVHNMGPNISHCRFIFELVGVICHNKKGRRPWCKWWLSLPASPLFGWFRVVR